MKTNSSKERNDMAHHEETTLGEALLQLLADPQDHTQNGDFFAAALRLLLNEAMKIERAQVLGAQPYERTEERRGYANGFKPKTMHSRLGALALEVPQVRGGVTFYPSALERGVRSERALTLALAEMYVQGVSTRKVTRIVEQLCGLEVTSTQVSRAAALLDEQLEQWRKRPLGEIPYLILDARYEKVRLCGTVVCCAVLIAIGITPDGRRSVLGVSVSLSEAEVHWREFLAGLQARGLHGVQLIVSDDHAGLKAACTARLASVPWQRCQFHLAQNALHHVPRSSLRPEVAAELRAIFDAPSWNEAEERLARLVQKYEKSAPQLARWLESNVPEALSVFAFPTTHRRFLRTSNLLERVNKEVKRRTRVATLFPNEASLLRLVSAVLMEISEEWESGRVYLNMAPLLHPESAET
jgi:transposase-like protein